MIFLLGNFGDRGGQKMKNDSISLSVEQLQVLSDDVRRSVFEICLSANNGHIGGSSGAVELLTTLYFGGILNYNNGVLSCNKWRDRVLIRGHLGPLRYKIFSLLGHISINELQNYRRYGSRLHGHEDHQETPGVDITPSGSLGMLLSYGVGCAYAAKNDDAPYMTYVFLGDGEEQEGNVSEAARHAARLQLNNITVIIDCNKKQLSNPVSITDSSNLEVIWEGYGWNVVTLDDGHDIEKIIEAYKKANNLSKMSGIPVVILAHTSKGFGVKNHQEHFSGYHTISTCQTEFVEDAVCLLAERIKDKSQYLSQVKNMILSRSKDVVPKRTSGDSSTSVSLQAITPNSTTIPHADNCQLDYFCQLASKCVIGELDVKPLFFLTADVTREDHVKMLKLRDFCTFLNVGIREQHMIAMAHGLSVTKPEARIVINSLDAFTYRSLDQVNAAVQEGSSMVIISDVSGLTNSRNGKTHQSAGQPGAIFTMPGVIFLEPWTVQDVFNCLNWALGESRGVVFIRIHSSDVRLYADEVSHEANIKAYIVHDPVHDPDMTIVASGITVGTSVDAAKILSNEGVMVRVVNVVDHELDRAFAELVVHNKPLVTVYNGQAGILQGNVSAMLLSKNATNVPSSVSGMGFNFGTTGDLKDLLGAYKLDSLGIVDFIKKKRIVV